MIDKRCWCGGRVVTAAWGEDGAERCFDSPLHDPSATGRKTEVKKLYIAGPMSGYLECNYPAFNRAAETLRMRGYEVVNPVDVHVPDRHHYVDLLREDLRAMLDCDGVAVLENWWESTGARNEVNVAGLLKMPVRTVREWNSLEDF